MNKLNEMWTALAAYQPQADKAGHGDTWATMCREKTSEAAWSAAGAAASEATDAAEAAAMSAWSAGDDKAAGADWWAQKVIDGINKLKE
jgi:hypothetical protein